MIFLQSNMQIRRESRAGTWLVWINEAGEQASKRYKLVNTRNKHVLFSKLKRVQDMQCNTI